MNRPAAMLAIALALAPPLLAQGPNGDGAALTTRLAAIAAVTGLEQRMADTIVTLLPAGRKDRAGNAVSVAGSGAPRRLVACPLDEPGWVVGRIQPDGYLTLRRAPGQPAPLRDQQLEGQRITIHTPRGAVPGVVAVRSIHLTRGRAPRGDGVFTSDSAVVDVGASSGAAARALGIDLLAPVTLAKRPHLYGRDLLAAPSAGRRAACAALLAAARRGEAEQGMVPRSGTVVIAFAVEQRLGQRGLATLAATLGPFEETVVVDGAPGDSIIERPALGRVTRRTVPVRYAGSAVETVALDQVERLSAELGEWIRTGR